MQMSVTQGFDPLKHIPPKYDLFGYLKKGNKKKDQLNVLTEQAKIKIPWNETNTNESKCMTQAKLIERRRHERIPDISYDLDMDGYVGGRDFVIAKKYDTDNDGKLNEKEKQAAYEGIANNVEQNYIWNIDNQGGTRPFRLLQKRGVIVDAEDFLPIRETYPDHPNSKIKPHADTFTNLKELRKKEMKDDINLKIQKWEKNNPTIFREEPLSIDTKKEPLFKSIRELKESKHRDAREKCGLEPIENDIKDVDHDPTLAYIDNPEHKVKGDLTDKIKRENQEQSVKLANQPHKSDIERLNEREDEVFAKLYNYNPGMTLSILKANRKKETFDYNLNTFSNQTIGVHGHELPKFSDNNSTKAFWKTQGGFKEKPEVYSHVQFKENIKYWKPPEELYLSEHTDTMPNFDPYDREKVLLPKKNPDDKLVIKVNNINIFKNFDPKNPSQLDPGYENRRNHQYRWTTLVHQFAPNKFRKGRFFDSLPKVEENTSEKEAYEAQLKEQMISAMMFKKKQTLKGNEDFSKKESERNAEINKVIKDPLYTKFSNKDQQPKILKNVMIRTQGF